MQNKAGMYPHQTCQGPTWGDLHLLCSSSQACPAHICTMLSSLLQPCGPAPSSPDRLICCPQMHPPAHVRRPCSPTVQPGQLFGGGQRAATIPSLSMHLQAFAWSLVP